MTIVKKITLFFILAAQCEASFFNNADTLTSLKMNDRDKLAFVDIFNNDGSKEQLLNTIKEAYPDLKIIIIPMKRVNEDEIILWRDTTLSDAHYDWFISLKSISLDQGVVAEYIPPGSITADEWSASRPLMEFGQVLVRNDAFEITFAHEMIHHLTAGTKIYDLKCPSFPDLARDTEIFKERLETNGLWDIIYNKKTYYKMDNDADAEVMLDHVEKALENVRCTYGNELDTSMTLLKMGDEFVDLFSRSELDFEKEFFDSRMQKGLIKGVNEFNFRISYLIDYLNDNPQSLVKSRLDSFLDSYKYFLRVAEEYKEYSGYNFSKFKVVEGL